MVCLYQRWVAGCGEGVVYFASSGRPTDIGLQLGTTAILVAGKGRVEAECFYFVRFFTFIPIPLSFLSFPFISSTVSSISSPFLWETTQKDPQGLTCR